MLAYVRRLGRWYGIGCLIMAGALVLAVLLPKCEGPGPHPFTQRASVTVYPRCTPAFGQCQVTEYRLHFRDGMQIWTCFAQPPVKPEGVSNVLVALVDCFQP